MEDKMLGCLFGQAVGDALGMGAEFMYCDESTIRYHHSWTGYCIYIAKYVRQGDEYVITELQVNRDSEQYGGTDDVKDAALFMALLTDQYGGDSQRYKKIAF